MALFNLLNGFFGENSPVALKYKAIINDQNQTILSINAQISQLSTKWFTQYQQYQLTLKQFVDVSQNLATQQKLNDSDKQTIAAMEAQNQILMSQIKNFVANSLYGKPKPAMLTQVKPTMVMLADFTLTNTKGQYTFTYPSHPSIFSFGPLFEAVLTKADCNRKRGDLKTIQICKLIANVLQVRESYMTDQIQWGRPDNWTIPQLVYFLTRDDCESLATLIISCILYYEMKFGAFEDYTVTLTLGHFMIFGHGYVGIFHNTSAALSDNYIIEATDAWASNPMSIESVKAKYSADWGVIGYTRADYAEGTYSIDPNYAWWHTVNFMPNEGILEKIKKTIFPKSEKLREKEAKMDELKKFSKERKEAKP